MLKLTRTGIGLLTRQYRSVLHKCWMINVGLWQAIGDAVSKAVSVPARLVASLLSGGALNGEAFNALDEILLSRLFERKLASLTAIGLTIAALALPSEAEAGVLCYNFYDGTVKYTTGTACPDGTKKIMSSGAINYTAAIGDYSTALGENAQATQDYSTAVGHNAQATGKSSMALGSSAQATKDYSTALGHGAQANGEEATAVGFAVYATGDYSTALGYAAQATGKNSIAIGYKSTADEDNTVSFGRFGADSATLAQMKKDIDDGMDESAFTTKYDQYNADGKVDVLYMFYPSYESWEVAVEDSEIAGVYPRITNVGDGVNAHDAMTIGQLGFDVATYPTVTDYLSNNYYTNVEFSMAKNPVKVANDNNFTTLNCVKEA